MLNRYKKKFDLVKHPECFHNWVHNAGKQCEWDRITCIENVFKCNCDSNNIAYMYICTMCGGEFWSSEKMFNIPHYRVKGVCAKC